MGTHGSCCEGRRDLSRSCSYPSKHRNCVRFLALGIGERKCYLGMKWLESLGGMQVDWQNLTMRFQVRVVLVIIQGDPSLSTSLVSLKTLWKAL